MRFMDVTGGYGGIDNYIDASDLAFGPQVGNATWHVQTVITPTWVYAKYANTNPSQGPTSGGGNGTYNYPVATKIYGNQPWAVSGTDAPFTITGTVTSGSPVVTGVSATTGIIAGATISGTGIPAGTAIAALGATIIGNTTNGSAVVTGIASTASLSSGMTIQSAYVPAGTTISAVNSSTQITLSANATGTGSIVLTVAMESMLTLSAAATASGSGETLTVTNPPWTPLSASDGGKFAYSGINGAQTWVVLTLDTGGPAHGLKTGQYIYIYGNANTVPATNGTVGVTLKINSNVTYTAWVTSPTTIIVAIYAGGAPTSSNPLYVNSTTPVTVNWTTTCSTPFYASCVPYEYAAAMCSQVGCDLWLNIPHAASDSLVRAIAAKVIANIGPTSKVYLEFGNENWNGSFPSYLYHQSLSILMGYVTPGTSLFDGHLVAYGQSLSNGFAGSVPLTTSHAFDTFVAAWSVAGLSTSRIKRVYGSQYSATSVTQNLAASLQQYGITAVDYFPSIAPYMTLPNDLVITAAFAPAGSVVSNSGSWPVDAMNDLYRYWMAYSQTVWCYGKAMPSIPRDWGNRSTRPRRRRPAAAQQADRWRPAPTMSVTRSSIRWAAKRPWASARRPSRFPRATSPRWRCRRGRRGRPQ